MVFGAVALHEDKTNSLNLEDLYDEHSAALYRYALAMLGSPEDAEDAVQEVFVRVARSLPALRKVDDLRSYLYVATRNAINDTLRRKQRRGRLEQRALEECRAAGGVDSAGEWVRSEALRCAFLRLPPEQREVILLKAFDGFTISEIGDMLHISINTVASRYRYAIGRLRQALLEARDE